MKKYLPWTIRGLISVLFLVSAYAKLYPSPNFALGTFEMKQLVPMGFSPELAAYFSRSLIGLEFALGIAILRPNLLKSLVVPATIGLLGIFSVELAYEILSGGNSGNCGCFGSLIPMTPLQALIKNLISIGLLIWLMKLIDRDENRSISPLIILLLSIELFMFAAFPVGGGPAPVQNGGKAHTDFEQEDVVPQLITSPKDTIASNSVDSNKVVTQNVEPVIKAPKKVTSKYSKYTDYIPANLKIDEGRKLLCFFAPTCEHCMETAKEMTAMRKKMSGMPPMHIVFIDEGVEEIPNFFKFAGKDYSYTVAPVVKFWEIIGMENDTPTVAYLWNGNIRYFSTGIDDKAFSEAALTSALLKTE